MVSARPPAAPARVRIAVTRGGERRLIEPAEFDTFPFLHGDELAVVPPEEAAGLPTTWGDVIVPVAAGHSIRVPPRMEFFHFRGFALPVHLVELSGTGTGTFAEIGAGHVANFERHMGIEPGMTVLDVGCGIGRDALQLLDVLDADGRYIGVDVTRDSIEWCRRNISSRHRNFAFHHLDAFHELYNPFGARTPLEVELPVRDASVDRITAVSLFTHLLEDETAHYLAEFRRALKPSGLAYVTFFLHSPEALAAARRTQNGWRPTFEHAYGDGFYGNDPVYARGAVAFTEEALHRLLRNAGLRVARPYLKGSWSGLHEQTDGGQDGAVLARA